MKRLISVSLVSLSLSTISHADISSDLTITSNYLSRGVTQTDNQPAVQGSLSFINEEGLYTGIWISNVVGGSEIDLYAGLSGNLKDVNYDLGAVSYIYPNRNDEDYTELYAILDFRSFSAGAKYTVGSKVNDTSEENEKFIEGDWYYFISANTPLYDEWKISGTLGYYNFADDGVKNSKTSYRHIEASLSREIEALGTLTLAVSRASKESGNKNAVFSVAWNQSF